MASQHTLFLCLMSHRILDAFTNGGLEIGFFIPFDNARYFFPWTNGCTVYHKKDCFEKNEKLTI